MSAKASKSRRFNFSYKADSQKSAMNWQKTLIKLAGLPGYVVLALLYLSLIAYAAANIVERFLTPSSSAQYDQFFILIPSDEVSSTAQNLIVFIGLIMLLSLVFWFTGSLTAKYINRWIINYAQPKRHWLYKLSLLFTGSMLAIIILFINSTVLELLILLLSVVAIALTSLLLETILLRLTRSSIENIYS